MDPISISLLVGICTLLIERVYSLLRRVKKSQCCDNKFNIEFSSSDKEKENK